VLAPSGIGVLYVRKELMKEMSHFLLSGSMIKEVHLRSCVSETPPLSCEAGTPNIEGAIALGAAIDYLKSIGMDQIHPYEQRLTAFALERMKEIQNLEVYGPNEFGSFQTIYTLFIIGLFLIDKCLWQRIAYSILIFHNTYSLMYSFSRGAYVGFLVGLLFISLVRTKKLLVLLFVFF
jgi:hypothetical protein